MLLITAKCQGNSFYAFTASEVLREDQQGVKIMPTTEIKVKTNILLSDKRIYIFDDFCWSKDFIKINFSITIDV